MNQFMQLILAKLDIIEKAILKKEKPHLDLSELSDYIQISRNTIYQWTSRKQNKIPHYKVGKKLYFRVCEIDKWVLSQSNKIMTNGEVDEVTSTHCLISKKGGRR
ncbi:MAG: helix-turn-helix domain-containing protein [Candidatus Cloacimonetes bacterium]|nr:helix-turn-helix domain-containing protein [Candidatus Cloacimonadota bacterium]